MTETCETIKIKASHKSQGEYVEINKADFDPKVHEKYKEKKSEEPKDDAPEGEQPDDPVSVEKPANKKGKK